MKRNLWEIVFALRFRIAEVKRLTCFTVSIITAIKAIKIRYECNLCNSFSSLLSHALFVVTQQNFGIKTHLFPETFAAICGKYLRIKLKRIKIEDVDLDAAYTA